jgi:SAM-dependent methyltransferase
VAAVSGNAERIPLEDGSVDAVACAQSFHWFDHAVALPEIARVLRPGGLLALVWNSRDDRVNWVAQLSEIIGNETVADWDVQRPLGASGLFGPAEEAEFRFEQALDRETLLDLVLSRSYCAKLSEADREPVLAEVAKLYDEAAGEGGIRLAYMTECFRASTRKE